jgi:hypothetical protein
VRIGARVDLAVDGEGRAGQAPLGKQRPQFGREGEVAQAHRAHDVVDDAGVALGEPFAEGVLHGGQYRN